MMTDNLSLGQFHLNETSYHFCKDIKLKNHTILLFPNYFLPQTAAKLTGETGEFDISACFSCWLSSKVIGTGFQILQRNCREKLVVWWR